MVEVENMFSEYADVLQIPEMGIKILEAAVVLFAQKGYAATSVREIVQAAQATNPMLYYYFDNKEGVFLKLVDIMHTLLDQSIRDILNTHSSFNERLTRIVDLHFDALNDSPNAVRFMFGALFGARDSRPAFDAFSKRQVSIGLLQQIFDDAVANNEFIPTVGLSTHFLAAQFMGSISQQIMMTIAFLNTQPDAVLSDEACAFIGPDARKKSLLCFFQGAGTIHEVNQ